MTEKSYFWDGTVTGDAVLAPYNADEFNEFMFSSFLSNKGDEAYIIPGFMDDLYVETAGTGTHSVIINAGAACFNNYLYVLDGAITIPIRKVTTVSGKRKDLVVLRLNLVDGKIRLAVVEGAEATPTEYPALTRNASTYEVALAALTIRQDTAYVNDQYIYDRRKFIYNIFGVTEYAGHATNLLRNSEWLSYSGGAGTTIPPEEWIPGAYTAYGRTVTSFGSGRGDWGLSFSYFSELYQWVVTSGKTFTLKVALDNSAAGLDTQTIIGVRAYRKTGDESSRSKLIYLNDVPSYDTEILFTVTFPEDDIEKLYVYISDSNSNILIPQIILVPGYYPGGYRSIPEVIMFKNAVVNGNWAATAKSTGTTLINFETSFAGLIKVYTKAVILRLRGRDSGSAAAASCYLRARGYAAPYDAVYGHLEIMGVTNDVWRETRAIVPVDQIYWGTGVAGAQLRLDVVATGALTFDATVEVVGIIL